MTSKDFPILMVAATLVMSAGFIFAINSMMGGSVQKAPVRAIPVGNSVSTQGAGSASKSSFPAQAGRPRNREARRKARSEPTQATTTAPAPVGSTPEPSAPSAQSAPPAESAPSAPASPPPPSAQPRKHSTEPAPKPKPKRSGEDFYTTG